MFTNIIYESIAGFKISPHKDWEFMLYKYDLLKKQVFWSCLQLASWKQIAKNDIFLIFPNKKGLAIFGDKWTWMSNPFQWTLRKIF